MWDTRTGLFQPGLQAADGVTSAGWSPDGTRIVVAVGRDVLVYMLPR